MELGSCWPWMVNSSVSTGVVSQMVSVSSVQVGLSEHSSEMLR